MDRILYRSRVISFLFLVTAITLCSAHGWALNPTVTDVTTRSFSVVWTEGAAVANPNAYMPNIYKGVQPGGAAVFQNGAAVGGSQVEVIVASDQYALARGIVKFEVIGLDYNTSYYYSGNKAVGTYSGTVTTEKFKGLISTDPNDNDIVTNDIVHVPVYKADGKTPALGVLVIAGIYADAACTANKRSDYPITAWVGDGMPGDPAITGFTDGKFSTNNVCYMEFAALNLNNLFDPNHVPLQLAGDMANTPQVEGEYIKVTVVPGFTNDLSGSLDSIMPVPEITKVGSQKISSAKAGARIVFRSGLNTFTYPYEVPAGLTVKSLILAIHAAGGVVDQIRWYTGSMWLGAGVVLGSNPPNIQPPANGSKAILPGEGYLVKLRTVPQNFYICNAPTPTSFTLRKGLNFLNFAQVPNFYAVSDLILGIHAAGGVVSSVRWYDGTQWVGVGVQPGTNPPNIQPSNLRSTLMKRGNAYLIILNSTGSGNPSTITIDPLSR